MLKLKIYILKLNFRHAKKVFEETVIEINKSYMSYKIKRIDILIYLKELIANLNKVKPV